MFSVPEDVFSPRGCFVPKDVLFLRTFCREQGCGTGKFEDGSGSDILPDYDSIRVPAPVPFPGHIHVPVRIRICVRIHKRICIRILKHILIQFIYIYTYVRILKQMPSNLVTSSCFRHISFFSQKLFTYSMIFPQ